MNDLAVVYNSLGHYAEGEKLHIETLDIQRRVLGQDHPQTLNCLYNLGCLAALQGNRTSALEWLTLAVDHGLKEGAFGTQMAKDDDLKPLRGDPAFEALVARARGNAAKVK